MPTAAEVAAFQAAAKAEEASAKESVRQARRILNDAEERMQKARNADEAWAALSMALFGFRDAAPLAQPA